MKIRTILIGSAMAIAAPAIAQDAAPMPEPAPVATTAPAATTPAPAEPKTQRATAEQIATVVKADFAKYDTDSSGELNTAEFTGWMTAIAAASKAPAPSATWFTQASAQADTDKNKGVSQTELVAFLNG